ncbi:ABC transporter ATP-binding protein [Propionibacteriaceae bacterium Y1685]
MMDGPTDDLLVADLQVIRSDFVLDLRLRLAEGEVLVLLGPNGAGKSTALRALAGLVASDGAIVLAGRRVDRLSAESRRVGMVFPDHLLFPHLTVLDNIAFGPRSIGLRRRKSLAVAREWVERFDLAALVHRRPAQLSSGQSQRVALARALAAGPELLLLDEPLAALDGRRRMHVRSALRRELRSLTRGAIVVTHDPIDAMVLADRVVVVEEGRIVQEGSPAEVAAHPRTDHLAHVFGLNLVPGHADGATVRMAETPGVITASGEQDGEVFAAFAPAAVSVMISPPVGSPRNVWEGSIRQAEPVGDLVRLEVEVPALGRTVRADVTAMAATELEGYADRVWLAVKAAEVRLYPR